MVKEFHDSNGEYMPVPNELDSFAEFSSDKFRNLDEVEEFHDKTAEFPMDIETDSAVIAGAAMGAASIEEGSEGSKETEEEKREKGRSGKATKELIKNATNVSSAQALVPVAAALIVTSAIIIPFIDNMDVEVNLRVEFVAGILSYSIEIINGSEEEVYQAFVYEGNSVIKETVIKDGHLTDSISGLHPYKEHRVEVRSGTPALYVLNTGTIPAAPSWAEWGHLAVGFDVIDYGVYYHGVSGEATITLEDPYDEAILYSKTLEEGFNSDIITGLRSSHPYTLTVGSATTLYLYEEVETEYTDVEWDHITVKDNTIDYGVISDYSVESLTISLYDPNASSVVYTKELLQGYDSDTITGLQFGHLYELTVGTEEEIYLFETVVTDPETIKVTLGHLKATQTTVDYEVTVTGTRDIATAYLKDPISDKVLYSKDLNVGVNSDIIGMLEVNHTYLFIVSSKTETFISQNITTDPMQTEVVLNNIGVVNDAIYYEVTVTGNSDTVAAHLYDIKGKEVYSSPLSIGSNTGAIRDLEHGSVYKFMVSSQTKHYVEAAVTIESHPTEVILNELSPNDNTISYDVTLIGASVTVYAYLFDDDGKEVYVAELSEGTNEGIIEELEYDHEYQFWLASESMIYISETVQTDSGTTTVSVEYVEGDDNAIKYSVHVGGKAQSLYLIVNDKEGIEEIAREPLSAGDNIGVIEGLDYTTMYSVTIMDDFAEYFFDIVSTGPQFSIYLEADGNAITYDVRILDVDPSLAIIALYDAESQFSEPVPIEIQYPTGIETKGRFEGSNMEFLHLYAVSILIDGEEVQTNEVRTQDRVNLRAYTLSDVPGVGYDVSFFDYDYSGMYVAIYNDDDESSGYLDMREITASKTEDAFKLPSMNFNRTYYVTVGNFDEIITGQYVATEDVGSILMTSEGNTISCSISIFIKDFEDLTIRLYYDGGCEYPVSEPVTVTGAQMTCEFRDLEYGHAYYCGILWKGNVAITEEAITQFGELSADGVQNTIECSVTLHTDDLEGVTLCLYYDAALEEAAVNPVPVTNRSMEHTFDHLNYGTPYYVVVMKDNIVMIMQQHGVSTEQFSATISSVATGNSIQSTITFGITDFTDVTVGLYSDEGCDSPSQDNSVESIVSSPKQYNRSGLQYGTDYYIGVKYKGMTMVSDRVTTDSNNGVEVTASQSLNAPTTVIATVTFSQPADQGITIGIYTSSECITPVQGQALIDIQQGTEYQQYEFEGLTLGQYYIGVVKDGNILASTSVVLIV